MSTTCTLSASPGSAPFTTIGPATGSLSGNAVRSRTSPGTRTCPENASSVSTRTLSPGSIVTTGSRSRAYLIDERPESHYMLGHYMLGHVQCSTVIEANCRPSLPYRSLNTATRASSCSHFGPHNRRFSGEAVRQPRPATIAPHAEQASISVS